MVGSAIFTTGEAWPPFLVNAAISALATLPLFCAGDVSRGFGRERGAGPLTMFARAPLILGAIAVFGMYEAALMTLLPVWGVRSGLTARWAAATLSAVYLGAIVLQVGAIALIGMPASSLALFALLLVWGGIASGIYPVALSMAGDRFRGGELVSVNAAIIMAYGLGALVGPALGGSAMDLDDPQGLLWLFALLFIGLLGMTLAAGSGGPSAAR